LFEISSIDLGTYYALFDKLLVSDLIYLLISFISICLLILSYSGNLLLTLVIFYSIIYSLLFSYYVYIYCIAIDFFPFMNMFAVMIAIAIGADNAFIFIEEHRYHESCKQQKTKLQLNFTSEKSNSFLTTLVAKNEFDF